MKIVVSMRYYYIDDNAWMARKLRRFRGAEGINS
jgi:hypothetical protein